jgi:hypothetical protein
MERVRWNIRPLRMDLGLKVKYLQPLASLTEPFKKFNFLFFNMDALLINKTRPLERKDFSRREHIWMPLSPFCPFLLKSFVLLKNKTLLLKSI